MCISDVFTRADSLKVFRFFFSYRIIVLLDSTASVSVNLLTYGDIFCD